MSQSKTQHCICGFNFYIKWNGNIGHDQHGHEWTNPKKPKCSNEEVVNICLDTYNEIYKLNDRFKNGK